MCALAACKTQSSNYCADVPVTHNCLDDAYVAPDMTTGCTGNSSCSGAMPVCNLGAGTCVQCSGSDANECTGTTPVCGSGDTCEACTAHSQCASDVCKPDGSCSDGTDVAYVAPTGTGSACTQLSPCATVMTALATMRPYLKIAGTIDEQATINNQNVILLADPGAALSETTAGVILTVTGSSQVSIYGLTITGALGSTSVGISMPAGNIATLALYQVTVSNGGGVGISAAGGSLTIDRSMISQNAGGGISITAGGAFTIVNNFLFSNGTNAGTIGGVSISTTQNASNRIDFNSFNKNETQDGLGAAIQCVAGTFTARNNIMSGNGTITDMEQTGGTCTYAYSIVTPGTVPPGTGNGSADPLFVNTMTGDLHIQTGSPAIGAADPTSDVTGLTAVDIDGDSRPQGSADIGADEFKP
jgi:hypothetical protein